MTTGENLEQAAFWEELAPSWLRAEHHSEKVAGTFGRQAIERLAPTPGQRVLDIGCGSGPTTIELAREVGPAGEAVGADISPTLVAAAQQRAESAGVANASFVVADAQRDELGQAAFDAVFSRFGVMFFADPDQAFARLRRALRPGGSLGFVCWQDLFANEWMFVPGSAVIAVTGVFPPMPEPGQPGPFSLADPDRVNGLLTATGFTDIQIDPINETVVLPEADVASMASLSQSVGPVREALRQVDDETRHQVAAAVTEALEAKVVDGELRLSAGALLVTAAAP
jgi:SAM-dependent methyltransferase